MQAFGSPSKTIFPSIRNMHRLQKVSIKPKSCDEMTMARDLSMNSSSLLLARSLNCRASRSMLARFLFFGRFSTLAIFRKMQPFHAKTMIFEMAPRMLRKSIFCPGGLRERFRRAQETPQRLPGAHRGRRESPRSPSEPQEAQNEGQEVQLEHREPQNELREVPGGFWERFCKDI